MIGICLLFIFIEVLIFLSGERVAFFFNTLAAIFIIIMIENFKKLRLLTLISSFIIIFFISAYDNTAKKRIWDQTIDQIGLKSQDSKLNIFSVVHQSHYTSAYKMYLDNKSICLVKTKKDL